MTDKLTLAYLAGAMDSDGYFTIKRNTYYQRKIKGHYSASYSEKIGLKQVTPIVPVLLKATFGGCCLFEKKQGNSKNLWSFTCENIKAKNAIKSLFPFLKIKKLQANLILEFGRWKRHKPTRQLSFWYNIQYPNWKKESMLTIPETQIALNYKTRNCVNLAILNGTLLALDRNKNAHEFTPCVPKGFIEFMVSYRINHRGGPTLPPQLIEKYEEFWQAVREANKIGINGTPVYHRTGCYAPLLVSSTKK
ncbi:hypothetical protein KA005_38005 [bacterium]|nr:hypothetical protein [bacterium]